MKFRSFGFSDVGKSPEHNEDSYLRNVGERLFLIADGIGGHASGEMASRVAVKSVEEFVIRSRTDEAGWPVEHRSQFTLEQNRLLAATKFANARIQEMARQNPSMEGMGTTLVGAIIEGDHLAVVNVGDSRIYLVRDGNIEQITQDHTLVGTHERAGKISKDQARRHPQRHILTSALGVKDSPRIDVSRIRIRAKDLYLFCSDGLNDMLDDTEILAVINSIKDKSLYKIGLSLVLKANLAGGLDNITVILLAF